MTYEHEFGGRGKGHNGGPLLDDDDEKRIDKRLQRDKHFWRDRMDRLKLKDLNAWWRQRLERCDGEERARVPGKLTHARADGLKRLYSKLCNFMSADPDNDPGEAWPTQVQLADALGWSERNVRQYMRMLEVVGLVWTHRTKRRPRQCVTRNHYKLMPPMRMESNRYPVEQPARSVPGATGT